jgi:hypothetical protein
VLVEYGCWLVLKFIFVSLVCILKVCDLIFDLIFDLLGHPVIAHLGMPKSIPAHSQNLSSLFSWSWRDAILLARVFRSFAYYATEFIFVSDVLKEYPLFSFCSHLRNGSRNIIKRYELIVSSCMVLLCMEISCVLPKYSSMNVVVVDCE